MARRLAGHSFTQFEQITLLINSYVAALHFSSVFEDDRCSCADPLIQLNLSPFNIHERLADKSKNQKETN